MAKRKQADSSPLCAGMTQGEPCTSNALFLPSGHPFLPGLVCVFMSPRPSGATREAFGLTKFMAPHSVLWDEGL